MIFQHPSVSITLADAIRYDRSEMPYRVMVELACFTAIMKTVRFAPPLPKDLNAGIAFSTVRGENYPLMWRIADAGGRRMRPRQFDSSVHNSAPGASAIRLGLFGPQIVLVEGDARFAAELQIKCGRSRFMLVCSAEAGGPATCYVLEASNDVL